MHEALSDAGGAYRKAGAATAKNKAKNNLVKEYYAAWRTAMSGIAPEMEEIVISYNRRQAQTAAALQEKAERLKLE